MKKLILILTASIVLFSCEREIEVTVEKTTGAEGGRDLEFEYGDMDVYHIQEIDGCEYILVNGRENSEPALTHKGNCKYCLERNKQSVIEVNKKEEY
jgi:hypothetical protein